MKRKEPDISIKDNFITMDLETRTINNIMQVISASIYDGNTTKSFYLTDFESSDELVKNTILYTLQRKYNGYKVYIHNFSRFDSAFIIKVMAKMNECKISRFLKRDGRILEIKVSFNINGKRKYSIYFRDSLLILPSGLKQLGENFSLGIRKTIFPYKFINDENIHLDYKGEVPNFKFFNSINSRENLNNISYEEYLDYKKSFKDNI
jgi:hypothetical protein